MARDSFYEGIRQDIAAYGQRMMGVMRTADAPPEFVPFTYTIGNHERGLPELLLIGNFDHGVVGYLLNTLGKQQRDRGKAFEPDELVDTGGEFPVKMMLPDLDVVRRDFTIQVGQYYRHEGYQVLQVLLCDKQGRYPGHPDCKPLFAEQTLRTKRVLM
jgi:hypothetical protein